MCQDTMLSCFCIFFQVLWQPVKIGTISLGKYINKKLNSGESKTICTLYMRGQNFNEVNKGKVDLQLLYKVNVFGIF